LALSLATLSACSSDQPTKLAPIPPVVVKVPVTPELPADATTPCAVPQVDAADIVTDVDLAGLVARWRVTALCNGRKLEAIGGALKRPEAP
jgi:hypothetical protein